MGQMTFNLDKRYQVIVTFWKLGSCKIGYAEYIWYHIMSNKSYEGNILWYLFIIIGVTIIVGKSYI